MISDSFRPVFVGGHLGIILILYLSGYIAYYYGWPMIFYVSGKYIFAHSYNGNEVRQPIRRIASVKGFSGTVNITEAQVIFRSKVNSKTYWNLYD